METNENYTQCNFFKKRGIPVVFGTDERGLTYSAPNWKSIDLTITGMFFLASGYLTQLQKRGSYLEFGVFDGRSFTIAGHSLKKVCDSFYAFDSFAGIYGATEEEEVKYPDGSYYANEATFWHNIRVAGLSDLPIKAIPGTFQDTLQGRTCLEDDIDAVSIVHIDVDIAEAALLALEYVTPALLDGALILFDEFHAFGANNNMGERLALRTWLERHPEFEVEVYRNYTAVSRSYIVHRR